MPAGGTRHTASPGTPNRSRLVARTVTFGHARRTVATSSAHGSSRCSQVSRQTSTCRSRSCEASARSGSSRGSITARTATASARGMSAGSVMSPRSTQQTPSGQRWASSAAARRARRVFPLPPGPATVTRRRSPISARSSACSVSRPTKLVSCVGRFSGPDSGEARAATTKVVCGTATGRADHCAAPGRARLAARSVPVRSDMRLPHRHALPALGPEPTWRRPGRGTGAYCHTGTGRARPSR